eukprot:5104708-Pyramimonas_sp.AAC.2
MCIRDRSPAGPMGPAGDSKGDYWSDWSSDILHVDVRCPAHNPKGSRQVVISLPVWRVLRLATVGGGVGPAPDGGSKPAATPRSSY